jgi:hypothetical protein
LSGNSLKSTLTLCCPERFKCPSNETSEKLFVAFHLKLHVRVRECESERVREGESERERENEWEGERVRD